jgi:AbrB family looped-hinge helix DNA binding protein
MPTSTLTTRGQTTIPKPIRDALDLQPGDRLEFTLRGDQVVIRRAEADLAALDGMLDRSREEPVSIEEMNEAIGQSARESVDSSDTDGEQR